ncbi:MAG TPA: sugar transferase [Candidatus Obscuribacterales bacterium]
MKSSDSLLLRQSADSLPTSSIAPLLLPPLMLADAGAVLLTHWLAYWVRMYVLPTPAVVPPGQVYLSLAGFLAILTPLIFGFSRVYSLRWRPLFEEFSRIALGAMLLSAIQFTAIFFLRDFLPHPQFTFSRVSVLLGWIFSVVGVTATHLVARRLLQSCFRQGLGTRRVLVSGDESLLNQREHLLLQGVELVGHCAPQLSSIDEQLAVQRVDLVLLRQQDWPPSQLYEAFQLVNRRGAELWLLPKALQLTTARQHLTELGGMPVLALERTPLHNPFNRLLKRSLDLIVALLGLMALSPLLFAITLAIRLGSPGPVLYVQERISRNGKLFDMYKFRTMQVDSEAGTGPIWASADDPRITPIGRLLRRSSLDELPQLLNVLRGDMSFVGPRPERPHFVQRFELEILDYPDRHLVKAGMTGWAQVNGLRGDTSIEERTSYDLYYIENWSLLFDLRIIARSFVTVLRDFVTRRAY